MSGYAQVTQGYTDCIEMAREKLELDAYYVRNMPLLASPAPSARAASA